MDYARAFVTNNYKRKDMSKGMTFENLELVRSLDGCPEEAGFVLTHVCIDAYSAKIVGYMDDLIKYSASEERASFAKALKGLAKLVRTIVMELKEMYNRSDAAAYFKFRTFMMGTKGTSMFPKGVIYEGVSDEYRMYRGPSGAMDITIPTLDALFNINMDNPENSLKNLLREYRECLPKEHYAFLQQVSVYSPKIIEFCKQSTNSLIMFVQILDSIRTFRTIHWNLVKNYIFHKTKVTHGTSGSDIIVYIPQQLIGVIHYMKEICSDWAPQCQFKTDSELATLTQWLEKTTKREIDINRDIDKMRNLKKEEQHLKTPSGCPMSAVQETSESPIRCPMG